MNKIALSVGVASLAIGLVVGGIFASKQLVNAQQADQQIPAVVKTETKTPATCPAANGGSCPRQNGGSCPMQNGNATSGACPMAAQNGGSCGCNKGQ